MRNAPPSRDVEFPIRAATLDLTSPLGASHDGFSRLLINISRDPEGIPRRFGGWARLGDGNRDLHDQLLNAIDAPLDPVVSTLEIYNHPDDVTYVSGTGFGFFIEVRGGTKPYTYQWQKFDGTTWLNIVTSDVGAGEILMTNAEGITSHSMAVWNAVGTDAGLYRCIVTDDVDDTATSQSALASTSVVATPTLAPIYYVHPVGTSIPEGTDISLNAYAYGIPTPTQQWQKLIGDVWTDIGGETGVTLTLFTVSAGDAGRYRQKATNSAGTAYSNEAVITVSTPVGYGDQNHRRDNFVCGVNNHWDLSITNPVAGETMTITWDLPGGSGCGLAGLTQAPTVIPGGGTVILNLEWNLIGCAACISSGEPQDFFLVGDAVFSGASTGITIYVEGYSNFL